MKRNSKKRLAVDATTIRNLSSDALARVAGGQTLATCSEVCSRRVCPDTQFIHGCGGTTNG